MIQEEAVARIVASLKRDRLVKAIFLKGSMGREEHDDHSDVDLYCLVDEEDKQLFLTRRKEHLLSYRPLLLCDDIFIIAPQVIAVFDNLLHIDLYTMTDETFINKDFFRVLYDPEKRLEKYKDQQGLALTSAEFYDDVLDTAWFLFQYRKSAARENNLWSVQMLYHVMTHFARVVLHHYKPERAQLGLKTLDVSVPADILADIHMIYQKLTPENHRQAVKLISKTIIKEKKWIFAELEGQEGTTRFIEKMFSEDTFC